MAARKLEIRGNLENAYADVYTPQVVAALEALAGLDADRKALMINLGGGVITDMGGAISPAWRRRTGKQRNWESQHAGHR